MIIVRLRCSAAVTAAGAWLLAGGLIGSSHGCGGTKRAGQSAGPNDASPGDAVTDVALVESSSDASRDAASDAAGDAASEAAAGGSGPACRDGGVVQLAGADRPQAIAVDSTSVYFTSTSEDTVEKVPIGGGNQTVLASSQRYLFGGLVVDATSAYWTNIDVMKVPLDGGSPTTIVSGSSETSLISVDVTSVYWTNSTDGTVMKAPLGGGSPTTLASGQRNTSCCPPIPGAIDATSVYWLSTTGTVMKVPVGGGSPTTLALGPLNPPYPSGLGDIAVDGTNVYWSATDNTDSGLTGTLMKVPVGGGASTTLASNQAGFGNIVIDGNTVYWSTSYDIWKMPLGGGSPTHVVDSSVHGGLVTALTVDAACVYWTAYYGAGGAVNAAPK